MLIKAYQYFSKFLSISHYHVRTYSVNRSQRPLVQYRVYRREYYVDSTLANCLKSVGFRERKTIRDASEYEMQNKIQPK